MKTLKIICSIIYSVFTTFLITIFLLALPNLISSEDGWAALGGVVLMVYSSVGAIIVYLAPIILSIIGLCKNKNVLEEKSHKKNKRYFIFMIVLPIASMIINFISYYIVLMN